MTRTTALLLLIAAALALALIFIPERARAQTTPLLDCTNCHVTRGEIPLEASRYPVLNGKPARYLAHQLRAYREGTRYHAQMSRTAIALGQGAPASARLYADLPPRPLTGPDTEPPAIVTDGAWERGIAPCASCHAREDDMRARLAPLLHGQPEAYLAHELRAYADGSRQSGTMGRMQAYAARLTSGEIGAIAAWYASFGTGETEPGTAPEPASEDPQ